MTARDPINLAALRARAEADNPSDRYWFGADEVLPLIDAVQAARYVASERSGHELGGEHPLYVKLLSLDEVLARFDFSQPPT